MINTNVTNVLQQITGITNTVILKYPYSVFNSPAGDILAKINIEQLDPDNFEDIGIYDLQEFLNAFKLFGTDRTVKIDGKNIQITESNNYVNLQSTSKNLLENFDKDISIFDKTKTVPTVAEFTLSTDDIKKIKQASSVFKDLSDIVFTSQDGQMNISLASTNNFNAKSNNYTISKEASTSKEFNVKVPCDNFNNLPNSDFTVVVKYNSTKDAYRVLFGSEDIDLEILMAVNK